MICYLSCSLGKGYLVLLLHINCVPNGNVICDDGTRLELVKSFLSFFLLMKRNEGYNLSSSLYDIDDMIAAVGICF